jgi:hypothetical protein
MDANNHPAADPLAHYLPAVRWAACKGTVHETACLASLAEEGYGELSCHAATALQDPEAREEAIGYIEEIFAADAAEDAEWIDRYMARIAKGHRAFERAGL